MIDEKSALRPYLVWTSAAGKIAEKMIPKSGNRISENIMFQRNI